MSYLNTFLYLVLPALGLVFYFLRRKYSYWAERNVPYVPSGLPLGTFKGMGTKRHFTEILEEVYKKHKKTDRAVGIYLGVNPLLLVNDLDLVKQICVKDFNSFRDRGMYFNEKDDPLSAHLFAIEGERWKFLRNKLSPTFTSGKIKYMFLTMQEIGDEFVACFDKYVEGKQPANVKALAQRFTSDVVGSVAFGLNCNALKNEGSELMSIGDAVFKPNVYEIIKMFFLMSYRDFSKKMGFKIIPPHVTEYFMNVVRDTVEQREKSNVIRQDFLQLLIQLKNKGSVDDHHEEDSKERITIDEVAAQAFVFFFAGFETTSATLSFALFEMARKPEIQQKAREEVLRVIAAHGGHITYDAIKEMTYVEQVVNETLRMHPPVGNLTRIANEPYRIHSPDMILEKDTMLMIPVTAIHMDPDLYPNPTRFDPDRFTPEAVQARHTHAFIPFGDGPRNCIGMRFALIEVKFGIARLLSRLSFSVNQKTELPLRLDPRSTLTEIIGGLWLDVQKI